MMVYVPATSSGVTLGCLRALLDAGESPTVYPVNGETSYFELLAQLWAMGSSFVLVEHDIVVGPATIQELRECPELWCAHSYEVFAGDLATVYGGAFGLGCTKFAARLLALEPDLIDHAGDMDIDGTGTWPKRSYGVMDATLTQALRQRGYQVHQHFPNVEHLHVYDREGVGESAWPAKARTW